MRRRTSLAVSSLVLAVVACTDAAESPTAVRLSSAAHQDLSLGGSVALSTPGKPAVLETPLGTFVLVPSRDEDRVVCYRLDRVTGALTPVSSVAAGDGPTVVRHLRGNRALVVNSGSHDLSVLRVSESGQLDEVNRVPAGGLSPADAMVVVNDVVVVANRGSLAGEGEGMAFLRLDAQGNYAPVGGLIPTGPQPPALTAGNDPHIISVGGGGLVVVGNSSSNDLTLFEVAPPGAVTTRVASLPVGASPKAVASRGNLVYVGLRAPVFGTSQDRIATYIVQSNNSPQLVGTTDAGWFLTSLDARGDRLFATTWSSPTTPANQAWVFDISGKSTPTFLESRTIPGSPSFQQLATSPFVEDFDIAVTQFQAGTANILTWFH